MAKTKFGVLTPEGKVEKVVEVDLSKIKSTDPLAFAYGYSQGKTGRAMVKEKDLAPEYIRGYKKGKSEYLRKRAKREFG